MNNPAWIAQRRGHGWTDTGVLSLIEILRSKLPEQVWNRRLNAVKERFEAGKRAWALGNLEPLYDPADAIFWYIHQAIAYASPLHRYDYFEPDAFRISPVFVRLSILLPHLSQVAGFDDRVHTLLTKGKSQPDAGIYEILVAGAYKSRGWRHVSFVPEQPGVSKTQDLLVETGRKRWAAECKRVNRNAYEENEYRLAQALAATVHLLAKERNRSVVMEVLFFAEVKDIPSSYLSDRAHNFFADEVMHVWRDEISEGYMRLESLGMLHSVLAHDDVFYGSSRMVELMVGQYRQNFDHSFQAQWDPGINRPLHAYWVHQASVVSWRIVSPQAVESKARHFKQLVKKASEQLPDDCPGVIHVGYEALGNNSVDRQRHLRNRQEMWRFRGEGSRLRWVYANYLMPEHTTAKDENWAACETMAAYRIGKHRTSEPLAHHLVLDSGDGTPGDHWR